MLIKKYKTVNRLEMYQGEDIFTETDIDTIEKMLNTDAKFIRFGDRIIAKSSIKEVKPYMLDGIQSYIMTFTKDIQEKLKQREKEKKTILGKGFESIEEVENWLISKGLIIDDK